MISNDCYRLTIKTKERTETREFRAPGIFSEVYNRQVRWTQHKYGKDVKITLTRIDDFTNTESERRSTSYDTSED